MEKSQMKSATLPTVEKQMLIRGSFAWNSGLKIKKYDKDKRYYLVVFDESTGKESFKHNVIMDLAFMYEF